MDISTSSGSSSAGGNRNFWRAEASSSSGSAREVGVEEGAEDDTPSPPPPSPPAPPSPRVPLPSPRQGRLLTGGGSGRVAWLFQVAEKWGDAVRVVKVDTEEEPDLSQMLQINGLPTIMFVHADRDQPAQRVEGLIPADTVNEIVGGMVAGAGAGAGGGGAE